MEDQEMTETLNDQDNEEMDVDDWGLPEENEDYYPEVEIEKQEKQKDS